ncbi:MAG: hypothetical protein RL766_786 [Bacteroidota bacterium]|jgi:hypothetical protein
MTLGIKHIIRFILLLAFQVLFLNRIPPLHQFIVPYIYFVFIVWLPFRISRAPLLLVSFATGMLADFFFITPGLHAASCVLIGFLRPFLINLLLPKEQTDWGAEEPDRKTMGLFTYGIYLFTMTFVHHFYLILLEWMQFGNFVYFLGKLSATSVVSIFLIIIIDLFIKRNSRNR